MAKLRQHIAFLNEIAPDDLFGATCRANWQNIEAQMGALDTDESIQEVNLTQDALQCDFSVKLYTGEAAPADRWLEMDHDACAGEIVPCHFFDASAVGAGKEYGWVFDTELPRHLPARRVAALRPMLERCVALLPEEAPALFQLGVMSGRGQDSVRLFTGNLSVKALLGYLERLGWPGDAAALAAALEAFGAYALQKRFVLDFDATPTGISEKIGLCFGVRGGRGGAALFLEHLEGKGLCTPGKRAGVLRWLAAPTERAVPLYADISHFKLPFQDGRVGAAKAYLRLNATPDPEPAWYSRPYSMNLELTERCPLRCPQCYCGLEGGRDMPLDIALARLREAAAYRVEEVYLSGGETLCYPHLYAVLAEAAQLGLRADVALSGALFGEAVLEKLLAAGISGIYISLNGSTETVNAQSRGGYAEALAALALLQQKGFARTRINWVMHSTNADDFEDMLALAQRYETQALIVMMFKPDAQGSLPTAPTVGQIEDIGRIIRAYEGPVKVEAEACFSQLRAVLGQRFFTNLNRGMAKGCGAGRDSFSVAVDGRYTPCRHLAYPEEWPSLATYWNQSPTLAALRQTDDAPQHACTACRLAAYCRPCMAVEDKMGGGITKAGAACALGAADLVP